MSTTPTRSGAGTTPVVASTPVPRDTSVASLAHLLHETAERHDAYEKAAPPHDWWDWYAAYLQARIDGSAADDASRAADRYMAEVKHVVVPAT
jgi:hypothetical protein